MGISCRAAGFASSMHKDLHVVHQTYTVCSGDSRALAHPVLQYAGVTTFFEPKQKRIDDGIVKEACNGPG